MIKESTFIYHEFPTSNRIIDYSLRHTKVELEDNLLVTLEDINTDELEFYEIK